MNRFIFIGISFFCCSISSCFAEKYSWGFYEGKYSKEELTPLGNKCRIILLRHGETEWNVLGKGQGWNDIPLNEKGIQQAEKLADKLASLPIKTFYASALSRAVKTAEIIASKHEGAVIVADPALRFYDQKKKSWYEVLKPKKLKKALIRREIIRDAIPYLHRLAVKYPGETVVVVSHGRVVKRLLIEIGKCDPKEISIKNANPVCFISDGKTLSIEE